MKQQLLLQRWWTSPASSDRTYNHVSLGMIRYAEGISEGISDHAKRFSHDAASTSEASEVVMLEDEV